MAEMFELISTDTEIAPPELDRPWPSKVTFLLGCGMAILAAAGCLGIYRELAFLWMCWTTDPLRSIGILIPPASIVLTLRVWRQNSWEMRGTWWGLFVIALAFFLSLLRQNVMFLAVAGRATLSIHPGIVTRLCLWQRDHPSFRRYACLAQRMVSPWALAALPTGAFPLQWVDRYPAAKYLGACRPFFRHIHRLCAHHPATATHVFAKLRHVYRTRLRWDSRGSDDGLCGADSWLSKTSVRNLWIAFVAGAVFLGYLFNFTRLCVLVLYYRAALGHPTMEGMAKQADYALGPVCF